VPDERELLKAEWAIQRAGIQTYLFREPDLSNQATALATEPVGRSLRKVFSKHPLWRQEERRLA
jgi:hypothetical protein